jgi:hypothetical protein
MLLMPDPKRLYLIGDHGRSDLLDRLTAEIALDLDIHRPLRR